MAEIKLSPEQQSETKGKPKRNLHLIITWGLIIGVVVGLYFNKHKSDDDFLRKKNTADEEKIKNANNNGDMDIEAMTAKLEAERARTAQLEKEKEADDEFKRDFEKQAEKSKKESKADSKADSSGYQEEQQPDPKVEEDKRRREQISSEPVFTPAVSNNKKEPSSPLDEVVASLNRKQADGLAELEAATKNQYVNDESLPQLSPTLTRAQEAEKWQSVKEKLDLKHESVKVVKGGNPNTIYEGSIISAAVYSLVTSDFPGKVIAKTTRPFYNKKGQVLIPAGSKVLGIANADTRPGQERMMVAFYRIIMPNGDSIYLSGMQGLDSYGTTGVKGDVDNHFLRMFGSSFLIAAIQSIFTSNDNSTTISSGGGSVTIQESAGQTIGEVGRAMLDRNAHIPPTISFTQGQEINILATKDIQIDPYVD